MEHPFARSGDVEIRRSVGKLSGGFSQWTSVTAGGVTEAMVSAITNDDATAAKTNAGVHSISAMFRSAAAVCGGF